VSFDALPVEAVDTTAAGDSFAGALAYSLDQGKDIPEAIQYATKVASITVTKLGAQSSLPYKEMIE
jgi:ribokinase